MSRTRQNRFRNTGGDRVEDQFGFLMNKNYSNTGGRSGAKKRIDERVTTGNTGQNFLSNFIYGKEGQRKGKLNPFGINLPDFGLTEAISGAGSQVADVFKEKRQLIQIKLNYQVKHLMKINSIEILEECR